MESSACRSVEYVAPIRSAAAVDRVRAMNVSRFFIARAFMDGDRM